jgi:hypothetical protein
VTPRPGLSQGPTCSFREPVRCEVAETAAEPSKDQTDTSDEDSHGAIDARSLPVKGSLGRRIDDEHLSARGLCRYRAVYSGNSSTQMSM